MTDVIGAIGAVIGYLGAEVAEPTLFDRLLWPQRYYNNASVYDVLVLLILMPMGGPLHRAALQTLDQFRENGLYWGRCRGHMLNSAFFHKQNSTYSIISNDTSGNIVKEARNGLWVQVLKMVNPARVFPSVLANTSSARPDLEGRPRDHSKRLRSRHTIKYLKLRPIFESVKGSVKVSEEQPLSFTILLGILVSELSAIGIALFVGLWRGSSWLAVFFCIPLIFKLFGLALSVRRERLTPEAVKLHPPAVPAADMKQSPGPSTSLFEIHDGTNGFMLIESSPDLLLPFFRHYGHPIRESKVDRLREIWGIVLVYGFTVYFPAGLLALLWMDDPSRYIWLGYQTYTIVAMHIVRLIGLEGSGRTESGIAEHLQSGKQVCFSSGGVNILAELSIEEIESFEAGKTRVRQILQSHVWGQEHDMTTTTKPSF
ncbi:hypothetical protein TWF506_003777 [Arthrobotrys conoides]|uniref:Uncharacterized protein n=1 Tax=Arthrobotrys conoides TaxID=74498 RepID=A0AAN8NBM4_9PEZI